MGTLCANQIAEQHICITEKLIEGLFVKRPAFGYGYCLCVPQIHTQCAQFVETLVGTVETLIETLVETVVNTCECCRNVEIVILRVLKN